MANKKIQKTVNVEDIPTTDVMTDDVTISKTALDEILYEMKSLKKQVADVEKKTTVAPSVKEKYTWPRKFSYKLYAKNNEDDVTEYTPILDYRSIKENPNKDWVYQNDHKVYMNNQVVMLTLAGVDKEVKAPLDALILATQSDKVFPKYLVDEDWELIKWDSKLAANPPTNIVAYIFETPEHWEFKVLSKCIN